MMANLETKFHIQGNIEGNIQINKNKNQVKQIDILMMK